MANASGRRQRSVTVLGGAETGSVPEDQRSIPEMVLEAVEGALDDAARLWADIDAIVTASVDLYDGLTASSVAVTEVVGAVMNPETRIAADGLAAAIHAVHQIAAGAYGTVLVVAHGKASMTPHWDLTTWAIDPIFLQPLSVDVLTISGLEAHFMAGSDPAVIEDWAVLAAKRMNAAAPGTGPVTADAILASPIVADPIRAGMCAPLGDGACAVVLGSESSEGSPLITGTGHDLDAHYPDSRNLTGWSGLERAAQRAYVQANIDDPADAFLVAEPSCMFPHQENLFVEATAIGTDTPLSPRGGLFAGTAPVTSGLGRLLAASRAVMGRPGRRALAHGTWGPAGQGQAVAIVEAT